jgi:quercetin dioxygenase-like cupin family protein
MELTEACRNERYKILNVSLDTGESMPWHTASSDAFVIARQGKGKLSFSNRELVLNAGDTVLIPARQRHRLDVIEPFQSSVILEPEAQIDFA